jgi:hypothetical protein
MHTKLTLSIEESLIEKAKQFARARGRSLSELVENYLYFLIREEPANEEDFPATVRSLKGSIKVPAGFNYKEELTKSLEDKYLGNG